MLRKSVSILFTFSLFVSIMFSNITASAATMSVWTASSYENVFRDAVKTNASSSSVNWVVVKNEFESAQIIMRADTAFTINSVTFSNLVSGSNTITSSNLQYNFVEYIHTDNNSWQIDASTALRVAPADFPDPLSNNGSISVATNTAQPIWLTLYVPKTAAAGVYTGTATMNTTLGTNIINITAEVCDVTIPDSKDANFKTMHWQQIGGTWHFDSWANSHPNDAIKIVYGYERWTTQWWNLVADMAQKMKDYRTNVLYVNPPQLLLDGGTTLDGNGNYVFNWSKFDYYIQYFIDAGVVKSLASHALTQVVYNNTYRMYLIKKDASGNPMTTTVDYYTAESDKWVHQYLPALQAHLQAKGWLSMWMQSVGDEPMAQAQTDIYTDLLSEVRSHCPGMKAGDAFEGNGYWYMANNSVDIFIPSEDTYQLNKPTFEAKKAAGKEVYAYNCNIPGYQWLNRFIDKPVWQMRSLGWLCYNWNIPGWLHWGWNRWIGEPPNPTFLSVADDGTKGDSYTVYPDVANNKIKSSIRYAAFRDASEDFEIFTILGQTQPVLAKNIASSIARDARFGYATDINAMIAARNKLVRTTGAANSNVAYWNLDEGSGTSVADTWGGNTGTINGGAVWSAGREGNALTFDGVDDGVYLGKQNIPGPWTASMWVKRQDSAGASAALMSSQTTALKLEQWNNTNNVGFTKMGVIDCAFNYQAPINRWVNLTFVGNEKGTSLYVNGNFQENISAVIDCPMETIGYKRDASGGAGYDFLKATLDEIKIYRRALTAAEIEGIVSAGVANFTFDEASGAANDSWNGYIASVSGGASRAAGKKNNAIVFNSAGGCVDVGMADIPVPWTASMWVRRDASKVSSALMSSLNGAIKLDQWNNTGLVGISKWGAYDNTFSYSVPIGQWVNLTFVGTSSGTLLYVNGALQGTNSGVISCPMDTIGYRKVCDGSNADYMQGAIDDVKVYSRALNQSEISQIIQSPSNYWSFDEGSGTAINDTWGGITGTINGAVWTASGKSGSALVFDGVNDGVYLGKSDIKGQWTASMWVKRDDSPLVSVALMASPNNGIKIEQNSNTNKVGITRMGVADYVFNYTAPVGTWVNLTFVGTNTGTSLYVNGMIQETITGTIDCPMETIGYKKDGPDTEYFKGTLDEVKVYDRALNASEVASLVGVTPASLVGYWKLDETSGTTAADSSGFGNNGTVSSGTWTTGVSEGALSFNGTSSYAQVSRTISDDFSIAFWVKTTQTGGTGQWYLGKGLVDGEVPEVVNDFGTSLVGSKFAFGVGNPDVTITSTKSINDGVWHYCVATREKSTGVIKVYVDGAFEATSTGGTQSLTAPPALKFGCIQAGGNYFSGVLDEVKIYNRVLSDTEIAQGYTPPTPPPATIILDNGQSGYTTTGTWSTTATGGYNNTSYQYATAGTAKTATWAPNLSTAGAWRVSIMYRAGTNRATSAKFNVATASGTQTVYVNQTINNLTWVTLGTWSMSAGGGNVTLDAAGSSGGTSPQVIADVVKYEYVSP